MPALRMPVRSVIHSSVVSTIFSRSALVRTFSGAYEPVPMICVRATGAPCGCHRTRTPRARSLIGKGLGCRPLSPSAGQAARRRRPRCNASTPCAIRPAPSAGRPPARSGSPGASCGHGPRCPRPRCPAAALRRTRRSPSPSSGPAKVGWSSSAPSFSGRPPRRSMAERRSPVTAAAAPSDVLSTTLPVKPSVTTTSTSPEKRSLPST